MKTFVSLSILTFSSLLLSCASSSNAKKETSGTSAGNIEMARQVLDSGDYKKAISLLKPMSREAGKNAEIRMLLGLAYLGNGNLETAENEFKSALALDAENADAALNLSYVLIVRKKYQASRKVLDGLLKEATYAYMEKVHSNYGLSYLEENKCHLAQKKFAEALELDPTFVTAHYNAGRCWSVMRNFPKAVQSFQKAVDFCPGCAEPALELSQALFQAGDKRRATAGLEKLLKSNPDQASAVRARQLLGQYKR